MDFRRHQLNRHQQQKGEAKRGRSLYPSFKLSLVGGCLSSAGRTPVHVRERRVQRVPGRGGSSKRPIKTSNMKVRGAFQKFKKSFSLVTRSVADAIQSSKRGEIILTTAVNRTRFIIIILGATALRILG